ncbi:MAG: c-type cytochrome [Anaerolineae bacterium]|nr:c-type cytochrome [Anaerolineae bacterium]
MPDESGHEIRTGKTLSAAQRIERLVVVVALIGLILTGLPQKYSGEPWAEFIIVLLGGIESARILHRFMAILLMAEAIYHVLALAFKWFVYGLRPVLLPGLKDWRQFLDRILGNLGLRSDTKSGNGFALKIEYLVLVVSAVLLIFTGLILLNPIAATTIFSGESIPVARSIHSNQALILVLFLVVWRFAVIFLWHPQRQQLMAERDASAPERSANQIASRRRSFLPVALVIAALLVLGVLWFAFGEQTAIDTVPRRQAVVFAPQVMPDAGDAHVGAVLWPTLRCAFCHGDEANGGPNGEPALRNTTIPFPAFYEQVRVGKGDMPAFSAEDLPDGYLLHIWAWLSQPSS